MPGPDWSPREIAEHQVSHWLHAAGVVRDEAGTQSRTLYEHFENFCRTVQPNGCADVPSETMWGRVLSSELVDAPPRATVTGKRRPLRIAAINGDGIRPKADGSLANPSPSISQVNPSPSVAFDGLKSDEGPSRHRTPIFEDVQVGLGSGIPASSDPGSPQTQQPGTPDMPRAHWWNARQWSSSWQTKLAAATSAADLADCAWRYLRAAAWRARAKTDGAEIWLSVAADLIAAGNAFAAPEAERHAARDRERQAWATLQQGWAGRIGPEAAAAMYPDLPEPDHPTPGQQQPTLADFWAQPTEDGDE